MLQTVILHAAVLDTRSPIFVSNASGFIARPIVLQLLRADKSVRGSARSEAKAADVRRTYMAENERAT